MATYFWDLGFNFDHRAKPDGTYDLQIGFVKSIGVDSVASPFDLKVGDNVGFSVYDLTSTVGGWDTTTLNAVIIELSEAKAGGRKTIFNADQIILNPQFTKQSFTKVSPYFGKSAWPYYRNDTRWDVHVDALNNPCEMIVTLWVTKTKTAGAITEVRKFIVDPEMIVDSQ